MKVELLLKEISAKIIDVNRSASHILESARERAIVNTECEKLMALISFYAAIQESENAQTG